MIRSFKKKPVVIEAMRWHDDHDSAEDIINWILGQNESAIFYCKDKESCARREHTICIATLEGDMHASYGDWIICGVKGEFYPCKPDIFDATYEEVTD